MPLAIKGSFQVVLESSLKVSVIFLLLLSDGNCFISLLEHFPNILSVANLTCKTRVGRLLARWQITRFLPVVATSWCMSIVGSAPLAPLPVLCEQNFHRVHFNVVDASLLQGIDKNEKKGLQW